MEKNTNLNHSKNIFDNYHHTFIIAEAGSNWKCGNHEDDLKQAKQLIKIAAKSGADAVKFQTYRADTVYADKAGKSEYLSDKGFTQDINEIFEYLSMPYEMISELEKSCQEENIIFMSTPFSVEDAKNIDPYVSIHKIASFEINHVRLLEYLAQTGKPILISTGASTFDEIDFAVNLVKKYNKSICLLQCTSKYPSPIESLNLSVIPKMKERYNLPIGFSDHSMDPLIGPLTAIGLGATVLEKHFTIDRELPGPDHPFALTPNELEIMIKNVRQADKAKGIGKKIILDEENELAKFANRRIQAIKNIKKGEIFKEGTNMEILRPGNKSRGLDPRLINEINGKKAKKDINIGEGITEYE
jgi:N-acetylneuraminate synthase